MDKFVVQGGSRIGGTVHIAGAKNAALPLISAMLLTPDSVTLTNVPELKDVRTLQALLNGMGARVSFDAGVMVCDASDITQCLAPYELVRTMRASILVLGPLLARFGHAKVSLPGGCAIGGRPVDQHLKALTAFGASITLDGGYIEARVPQGRLKGTDFAFDMVTVGGTENALLAAVLAQGTTRLFNCACEPEVVDLCQLLNQMGARITGIATSTLTIEGVKVLHGATYAVVGDRIEAGSYLAGALLCQGDVTALGACPILLAPVLGKFEEMGAKITADASAQSIRLQMPMRPRPIEVRTAPHPGFPTDMQAQLMTACALGTGTSTFHETIFENRFMHVPELQRLGARIRVDGHHAVVEGVEGFIGAPVMATDLRASMSLVMAAACAAGQSTIDRIYHIDRGYEKVEQKLSALGVDIQRIKGESA